MARDYTEIARQWEDDVLSGKALVGSYVRMAVQRQRNDLALPPDGYSWDEEAANKSCALAEQLAFPKGRRRGQRFILEPWQVFLIRCLFGWVDSITGIPRFIRVSIYLPKGSGKSPLAALIGLIVLARGKAIGAKIYCAATTQRQALNVFEPAQESLRLSPRVAEAAGLVVGEHAIKGIGDNRIFEAVSAEKRSADGTVGDAYLIDELHQHPNRSLYDVLVNNASKVEGSRLIVISTAGTDQSPLAIGWLVYCEARDVLLGKLTQPSHFVFISAADEGDDPWSETTWRKANLNYGISVSPAGFKAVAESARQDPGAQPHFLSTRLGLWTQGGQAWMDMNLWDSAAIEVTEEHFSEAAVFVGIDYAPKLDLTAKVQVAVTLNEECKRVYTIRSHAYLPEGSPTLRDIPKLKGWAPEWITLTPGNMLDPDYLRDPIKDDVKAYPGAEVCMDSFGLPGLSAGLEAKDGIEAIDIRQDWKHHSPAMREVQIALSQGRLFHDGSPVMRMCMANVVGLVDSKGNTTPGRENDSKKIDLAVGLFNAMYRAMIAELTAGYSVYSERGIISI